MKIVLSILRPFLLYLLLSTGMLLMLRVIIDYTSLRTDIHFLVFKQDYLPIKVWKLSFYIHVFSGIFALAAGLTQFSPYLLKHYRNLHRFIGKLYVIDILVINFPAAMVMAVYANGGLPSRLAFVLLDCLWFYFTYRAVAAARQGKITEHRKFMVRSYALTLSALTLRTWKIILMNTLHPDPVSMYMMQAWLGFVPNLLVAEWWIRTKIRRAVVSAQN